MQGSVGLDGYGLRRAAVVSGVTVPNERLFAGVDSVGQGEQDSEAGEQPADAEDCEHGMRGRGSEREMTVEREARRLDI